ncbi:unnamed protein product, partial [Laminaria digitata]
RDGVNTERWFQGLDVSVSSPHGTYRVYTEHDPIEALRAYSVLGIRRGCGSDWAECSIIDAIDANRQTIYIRDHDDRLVTYKRIAISAPTNLVSFHTQAFDTLTRATHTLIDAQIMRFAHACNLSL